MDKILIVDDTPAVLQALSLILEIHGYDVITTTSPEQAISLVNQLRVSLVIQDMNFTKDTTSGEEGSSLFYKLRELNIHLPIILITAWTDLEQAVELVRAGAADYIAKPWDDQKLVNTVANLVELGKTKAQSAQLTRHQNDTMQSKTAAADVGLIYASAAMQRMVDMSIQVAKSDVSVLITGPNGAGKEKIAELIHAKSPLAHKPFVKVNCGALPADLIEAELFGAEAGAYTGANKTRIGRFEAANGGTLFLDEIGNLSYEGQTKLLRVLQTGEFERLGSVNTQKTQVRIISATNANLVADIANARFREDLFYRLNVIELAIPALAARRDDIMPLVHYFLPHRNISLDAERLLCEHKWPGNVRELENACKRVAVFKPEGAIEASDFVFVDASVRLSSSAANIPTNSVAAEPDKESLELAMREHSGVIARVARQFGMSRQALYRRLNKLDIEY
ncbi:sigma-54-dependent transcriptional regulator [Agaribacter marinus]|uniref:Sigma-54-dependent Fis family transcriptional regulator n=1 Tax=Agaribacter marinus TaxID=1431249 RepID=A0AA37SZ08_9ALTE|nr:sigma-54 dependent transcriptional regulator [Agaribacter marinus]GLR69158.1 sigma-54-dependent Fis family transcriptional regulator [Agaribacter marinus]